MKRTSSQPPIWFWMVVVLIAALYTVGTRILLAPLVGGDSQAALKIWVGFGLGVLSVFVLPAGVALCRREERITFFAIFRPEDQDTKQPIAVVEEASAPLGLESGQRLRLPDGAACVVRFCVDSPPHAFLDYDPKRESQQPGVVESETIYIDRERQVWRMCNQDFGPRCSFGKEATGWTLDDLRVIQKMGGALLLTTLGVFTSTAWPLPRERPPTLSNTSSVCPSDKQAISHSRFQSSFGRRDATQAHLGRLPQAE